jgi:hemerythrin-like domain-containing protein
MTMGKATQDLRNEHEAILYVLKILDRMMCSDSSDAENLIHYYCEVVYFLKIFVDKCHHGKEENYLFKALVKKGIQNAGVLVGAMLEEHVQGRAYIKQMSESLDQKNLDGFNEAAIMYRDLIRAHIEKENNILFDMADRLINERAQSVIYEQFEQHEETVIGHGVHQKLHAMIDSWAEAYGA